MGAHAGLFESAADETSTDGAQALMLSTSAREAGTAKRLLRVINCMKLAYLLPVKSNDRTTTCANGCCNSVEKCHDGAMSDEISAEQPLAASPPPLRTGHARRRATPRKRVGRTVLFVLIAVVAIAAVVSSAFILNLTNSFNSGTHKIANAFPDESLRPPASKNDGTNILVLGSDSRGATSDEAAEGLASDQRSDSMMLVHIPENRKNIYVMSIMRDTWVDIPGHNQAKINAAMAFGGIPLVVQTIEDLLDNRIDHVVMADFEGFRDITNAVGGVEVNVPVAFTSTKSGMSFAKGPQTLNGEQALAFVRERYAFTDGDYQRVKDQQIFMKALFTKLVTPQVLANPATLSNLVSELAPHLSVDKGFTANAVGSLLLSLRDVRSKDIVTFTLPTLGTSISADGQSIVLKDQVAIKGISQALQNDNLGQYLKDNNLG